MQGYGYIVAKIKGLSEKEMCLFNNPFSIESLLWKPILTVIRHINVLYNNHE